MCGKGSNTTTNTSTSSADPQAAQAYRDLLTRAQGVAPLHIKPIRAS